MNLNMILDTGSDKFVAKTWATIKAELEKIDAGASDEVFPGAAPTREDTIEPKKNTRENCEDRYIMKPAGMQK